TICQLGLMVVLAGMAFAANCPESPPIALPGTRGALVNPNNTPVMSAQIKFYYTKEVSPNTFRKTGNNPAAIASTDNQGAFDFSSIPGGVYQVVIRQRAFPPRTVWVRLPEKSAVRLPNKKEVWIKLAQNECDGFVVYVPNQ